MRMEKPESVRKALHEKDTHALRAMGKKGGKKTAFRRKARGAWEEIVTERRENEERERRKQTNEDIAPID